MKTTKKLVSLLLAAMLLLSICVVASAATITIQGGNDNSEYSAYKLLNATVDPEDDKKIAYTVNDKYADVIAEVISPETDVVAYLNAEGRDIDAFAESIYQEIQEKTIEPDATITGNGTTSEDVGNGYFLIAETQKGDSADTFSLFMTNTAKGDNIVVTTKEDAPELEKKVKEKNDTTGEESVWQDGADYDLNDDVPFQLTGTVSSKIDDYDTYYYQFVDELSDGLTYNYDATVTINGVDVTRYFVIEETNGQLTITCDNLKAIDGVAVDQNTEVIVEYTAKLNENAVIGKDGNPNTAKLVYNNNPYYEGTGADGELTTSETPEDKVIVYTYKLVIDKVDGSNEALEGAGFTLYKKDVDGVYVKVGEEVTGVTTFEFARLDAGEYKIVETTVPDGYNKAADVEFTIEASYDTEADDPQFGQLEVSKDTFEVISSNGEIKTTIQNLTGAELPTTGGIGTTIFYVAGGLLVLVAVVLLVTKRRIGEEN